MPKKYPPEFKADVARVARRGELTLAEVAADFDISVESAPLEAPGRDRRRHRGRAHVRGAVRDRAAAPRQAPPGAGERDPAPGHRVLRQGRRPKMMYPLVQELAAEGIPVRLTCGVLGFSPQAFYKWRAEPVSERDWDDAHLVNAIVDVHADDPEFGYRFIADELEAGGHRASERRVWRLCRDHAIWSTTTRKGRKGSGKRPGPAVHDDFVQRDFTAPAPDVVWLTDITEHPTAEGKLYACIIKDLFSNRIVGYAIGPRMTAKLARSALRAAVARRQPASVVVVHSDRGSQYRSRIFRAALKAAKLKGSMGRVAAAGDNAAMESFNSLLQKNVLNRQAWATRDQLHNEIVYWIEHTYNRRRRQRTLGRLTPVEYELAFDPDDHAEAA